MQAGPQSFPPLEPDHGLPPEPGRLPKLPPRITWDRAFRIWWSFAWRTFVYGNIGTVLIEGLASLSGGGAIFNPQATKLVAELLLLVGVSFLAFKQALDAHSLRE
jgi:hypothetical protein